MKLHSQATTARQLRKRSQAGLDCHVLSGHTQSRCPYFAAVVVCQKKGGLDFRWGGQRSLEQILALQDRNTRMDPPYRLLLHSQGPRVIKSLLPWEGNARHEMDALMPGEDQRF